MVDIDNVIITADTNFILFGIAATNFKVWTAADDTTWTVFLVQINATCGTVLASRLLPTPLASWTQFDGSLGLWWFPLYRSRFGTRSGNSLVLRQLGLEFFKLL